MIHTKRIYKKSLYERVLRKKHKCSGSDGHFKGLDECDYIFKDGDLQYCACFSSWCSSCYDKMVILEAENLKLRLKQAADDKRAEYKILAEEIAKAFNIL